ncbi:MAG TPA: cysteine desulfurase family protein [Pyrinomonadaceae bacterium]|nr:cysteine desulfurase family protein [Pyrinomonadaceae bacterium]
MRRVYLDNSATTPIDPQVLAEMLPFFTEKFGNASSIHYFGQQTKAAVDRARHQVAGLINARPNDIIFTSGGTEANNLAIRGLIQSRHPRSIGERVSIRDESVDFAIRPHVVTSAIEHPAVKNVCEDLEKQGCEITYLPVYSDGIVRIDDVKAAVRENTVLISVMFANNEIGTIQPVNEIGRFVRELKDQGKKIWFHTDAVQAAGKIAVDVEEIGCDMLSMSAHKLYAPKGIGALYIRRGTRLHPQSIGGRQERGIRGGTEPVPLIVAFGAACEIAGTCLESESIRLSELRNRLEQYILETIPDSTVNGSIDRRLPNVSNISFRNAEGEGLLINLDMQGVAVSTGSACSSGSLEPSPVIRAVGRDEQLARGAIRFSLGRMSTGEDVDRVLEVLPAAVENVRRLAHRESK